MKPSPKHSLILALFFLFFFIIPTLVSAKGAHPKGYDHDKGKEIIVSEPLGWPLSVSSPSYIGGSVESLPEMAVIRLKPYNPWWRFWKQTPTTTTVFVSGLPKSTDLYVYTDGYRQEDIYQTDQEGTLTLSFPSETGQQFIIKSKPSTIHIKLDSLFGPPGGECEDVGTWVVASKTCTLNQNVTETIAIEDGGITLDGAGYTLTGSGTGDGVYVDVANAIVKNLTVNNFARGVVYSAPFSLFNIPTGGTMIDLSLSNVSRNVVINGISEVGISNINIDGGDTGFFLTDKDLDGFVTYDITATSSTIKNTNLALYISEISPVTFTRNNFISNATDLSLDSSALLLATPTNRGNFWSKNTDCEQDTNNPNHCVDPYDAGPVTDNLPWFCEDGWVTPCAAAPPTGGGGGGGTGGGGELWAEIKSTLLGGPTATLYLESSHTTPIKELPIGWVLKVLDEDGGYWEVEDVADNLVGYMDKNRIQKAVDIGENTTFENNAKYLSPNDTTNRAKTTYQTVDHYWNNAPNEDNKQTVYGLNKTTYDFVHNSSFPKELFLAMLSHESDDFDNEYVSFDYGHGITQLTVSGYTKDISYLQTLLKKLGHYTGAITGVFKDDTKTAVIAFQTANSISPAEGRVGPLTRTALNEKLTEKRTEIPETDIPIGFTFRMNMQVDLSRDRDEDNDRYDNRSIALGIKIYPCIDYKDFTSQTSPNGYKNCYSNSRMKANAVRGTPKATYYQNTLQSMHTNVREGLNELSIKYNSKASLVNVSPLPDIWITERDTSIDNTDMKILLGIRGYNGFGKKISNLGEAYPDLPLPIDDKNRNCKYYFDPANPPTAKWYLDAVAAKTLTLNSDYAGLVTSWTTATPMYKKLLLATENRQELCIGSPAYLQILDDQGNMTGYTGNQVIDEIANIVYDDIDHEAASIIIPKGNYTYRVIGTATDTYKFAAIDINNGTEKVFRALDIAINPDTVHEYNIDWENLTDTDGVTIRVDQDGDGIFERTVTSGTTITAEQFQKVTICHLPPGNPSNAQTISIGVPALKAHLKHGDYEGECRLMTSSSISNGSGESNQPDNGKAKGKKK